MHRRDLPLAPGAGLAPVAAMWAGRVDAIVSTTIEAAFLTREYPDLVAILADRAGNPIPMAFLSPLNDPVFLNVRNAWVTMRLASGFCDTLNRRWNIVQA